MSSDAFSSTEGAAEGRQGWGELDLGVGLVHTVGLRKTGS